MLDIIWGRENVPKELVPKVIMDSREYFNYYKTEAWFQDEFVKEVMLAIDKATVYAGEAIINYEGKCVSPTVLSTGCKCLCCIHFFKDNIFYGGQLGNNCLPLLIKLAATQDITIILEHFADFTDEDLAKGLIRVNGTVVDNFDDYGDTFSDWCETTESDDYETRLRNCGL